MPPPAPTPPVPADPTGGDHRSVARADYDVKNKKNADAGKALSAASTALQRAQALGHVDDKAAKDFQKQIDDLDRKVKGNESTGSLFSRLRNSVSSVFKKQSETSTGMPGGKVP